MESIESIRRQYRFAAEDEERMLEIADIMLPLAEQMADEFYDYLMENPYTASFFTTEKAVELRKETIKAWFTDLFTAKYDNSYLLRLDRLQQHFPGQQNTDSVHRDISHSHKCPQ